MNQQSTDETSFDDQDDIPPYMEVDVPEPSNEQRLALYAIFRRMGGTRIEELEELRREVEAQSEAA